MSDKRSALDELITTYFTKKVLKDNQTWFDAQDELFQLRATVAALTAELNAAHVYLDESCINGDADAEPVSLMDRLVAIVARYEPQAARIAELEQAVIKARYILMAIDNSDEASHLFDISVRTPSDAQGIWICDAVSEWICAYPSQEAQQVTP